jgi:hypothetical protein
MAVMDRIKARYVAAGAPLSCFQPTFCMQNAQASAFASFYVNYKPDGVNALKDHIKVLGSAPYVDPLVSATSTDANAFFEGLLNNIDSVVEGNFKTLGTVARANGLTPAAYEYAQSISINDATTRNAVEHGSRMYDFCMHLNARTEAAVPGALIVNFLNVGPTNDGISANQDWGLLPYSGKTPDSTTPKYNAAIDYIAGKRKLIALSGTLAANAGDSAGKIVGTLSRRTPGSSLAITTVPAGALSFVDPLAQTLQVQIADASAFASSGTVTWSVVETDPRDTAGSLTTNGSIVIPAPGSMNIDFVAGTYNVNGTSYASLSALPGYAYSRANALTVPDSDGSTDTFAANTVPVNGFGLHSYVGVSNLISNGQAFDNASWTKTNLSVTANTTVAPDATTTADTVNITTGGANNLRNGLSATINGNPYTYSIFAMRGTATSLLFSLRDNTNATWIVDHFNFYAQTNGATFARIVKPFTATSSNTLAYVLSDAGAGTVFLWQAQVLAGNFPDGGPIVTTATSTPTLSWTFPNGTYSVTYTFDDNSTQVVSQTVSGGLFTALTAPTLNRGRIKSIVA